MYTEYRCVVDTRQEISEPRAGSSPCHGLSCSYRLPSATTPHFLAVAQRETLMLCKPALFCHPQVKIEKEKVYIRASKQVRGHWHPKIKANAFSFCCMCVGWRKMFIFDPWVWAEGCVSIQFIWRYEWSQAELLVAFPSSLTAAAGHLAWAVRCFRSYRHSSCICPMFP